MGGSWSITPGEIFDRNHSDKGGIKILIGMRKNGATLQRIGHYFGITRERVRQICEKLNLEKFDGVFTPRSIVERILNSNPYLRLKFLNQAESNIKKGLIAEALFYSLNRNAAKYNGIHAPVDFDLNGTAVEVKYCGAKFYPAKKRYPDYCAYRFSLKSHQKDLAKYIFVVTPESNYFIPSFEIKGECCYLSQRFGKYKIGLPIITTPGVGG